MREDVVERLLGCGESVLEVSLLVAFVLPEDGLKVYLAPPQIVAYFLLLGNGRVKRGIGRTPRTGKEVRIPPGRTIRFKPGKDLQNIS